MRAGSRSGGCGDRQAELGCDHRAVFATTYLELTEDGARRAARRPGAAAVEAVVLPRGRAVRERVLPQHAALGAGRARCREAWRIAFETAASGEVTGGPGHAAGDQRPCAERHAVRARCSSGCATATGMARKPDHDLFNDVLSAGYEDVVGAVRDRYDPRWGLTNPPGVPADDVAGLEIVRQWRENVWRNAERLVNARPEAERARIAAAIQSYAARVGARDRGGAVPGLPGARATSTARSGWAAEHPRFPSGSDANICSCPSRSEPEGQRRRAEDRRRGRAARHPGATTDDRARALRPGVRARRSLRAGPVQVGASARRRRSSSSSRATADEPERLHVARSTRPTRSMPSPRIAMPRHVSTCCRWIWSRVDRAIQLAARAAENGQRACLNWAADYELPGAIAQLGERRVACTEVVGSSPTSSTSPRSLIVGAHEYRNQLRLVHGARRRRRDAS